jgi:hypothetical protein
LQKIGVKLMNSPSKLTSVPIEGLTSPILQILRKGQRLVFGKNASGSQRL